MVAFNKAIQKSQTTSIVHVTEPAIEELKDTLQRLGVLGTKCFRIEAKQTCAEMSVDAPHENDITLCEEQCALLAMDKISIQSLADRVLHFDAEENAFYWLRLVDAETAD